MLINAAGSRAAPPTKLGGPGEAVVLGLLRWSSATLEDCINRSEAAKEGKRPFLAVLVSYTPLARRVSSQKELANAGSRSAQRPGGARFIPLNKR